MNIKNDTSMNNDISEFGVLGLASGKLIPLSITSTNGYNHYTHHIHHFIKKGEYKRNKAWFDERGIEQKLILLPIWVHLAVHSSPASPNISDEQFLEKFRINKWDLLFNRKKWRDGYYDK